MNNQYYRDLSKLKPLPNDEVIQKIIAYQNGNEAELKPVIESHLRFVVFYAKKFNNYLNQIEVIELEDLISEGNIGLIRAVAKFNPELNIKFSYYASLLIVQTINDFIQSHKNIMKNANNKQRIDNNIKARINELSQMLMKEVNVSDLPYLDKFTKIELDRYDNKIQREPEFELLPLGYNQLDNDELFEDDNLRKLRIAITKLTEREAEVIKYLYGMMDENLNSPQIAKKYNISKARAYQIRDKALMKLNVIMTQQTAG
jgi:RNA polymerase sigma factor (sigma-70 family)